MFDWDEDHGDLMASKKVGYESPQEPETTASGGYVQTMLMRWVAPTAVVAALLSAGISLFDPSLHSARIARASVSSFAAMIFGADIGEPPAELVAYGPEQFENFMQAMADFSDTDLLDYAATTARDLGDHTDPTTPFMLDVLFLTHREIGRRGLSRPTASLRIDSMRASFSAPPLPAM